MYWPPRSWKWRHKCALSEVVEHETVRIEGIEGQKVWKKKPEHSQMRTLR